EELAMTTNLALSYGAKGIIYFWYGGGDDCGDPLFGKGFIDDGSGPGNPRYTNAYGQAKWDTLVKIHKRIRKWAPYLINFDYTLSKSYKFRIEEERNALLSGTYIHDVITYSLATYEHSCMDDPGAGVS